MTNTILKTKRLPQHLITLLLLLMLVGCAVPPEEAPSTALAPYETAVPAPDLPTVISEPTATATVENTASATEVVPETNGRLPNLNGRSITIAVENSYLPFNYILAETGTAGGWDYEVWHEICVLLNCVPVFETAVWSDILPAVAAGEVDVASNSIAITPERTTRVEFSDSYLSVEQRLLARSDEHSFTTIDEFVSGDNYTVGVRADDTSFAVANSLLDEQRIQSFTHHPNLFDALGDGEIDAMIIPVVIGDKLQHDYMGVEAQRFKFASERLSYERLGFIFPQGSELTQPVNLALQELYLDGTLSSLAQYYFSDEFTIMYSDIEQ